MTDKDRIAAVEANRLREDPAFQAAVLSSRRQTLEALSTVDPSDIEQIRTLQARVKAIDLLATELAAAIIRGTPQRETAVA